jgi:hypothetical protein
MAYRLPFSQTSFKNILSQNNPLLPNVSVTALALESFAPNARFGGNDAHPSDLYDSLEQEIPGKTTEALYFSLTAQKLAEDTTAEGHEHQNGEPEIEWLPVWQSNFCTGLAAGVDIDNAAGCYHTSQTYKEVGWAILNLGEGDTEGQTFLYFRARGTAPAVPSADATDLDVKVTLFQNDTVGSHEITTTVLDPFVIKIPNGTLNDWVTAPVVDLGGELVALITNQGWKFLYAKFEIRASGSPGAVTLYEIQVGRIASK